MARDDDFYICYNHFFENYWRCNWQNFGYILMSIVSIPIYLIVLVTIVKERSKKNSPFRNILYTILLSQGIADFAAMLSFSTLNLPRSLAIWSNFYNDNKVVLAPLRHVSISKDYLICVRCFGDFLFALQRFCVFKCQESPVYRRLSTLPFLPVFCVHWLIPAAVAIPMITRYNAFSFSMKDDLVKDAMDWRTAKIFAIVCCAFVLIFFMFTVLLDLCSFFLAWTNSRNSETNKKLEYRILFIVALQSFSFSLISFFYVCEAILFLGYIAYIWEVIKPYFPLINGFESYFNPYLYLGFNSQLRKAVLIRLHLKKERKAVPLVTFS